MEFIDRQFSGGVIRLDGKTYRDCRFDGVILEYAGGKLPTLTGNTIINCNWRLVGPAGRTLALLQGLNRQSGGADVINSAFPITTGD